MHLNLSTSRTNGGWMYFKINNGDYIQLSGSDNKVNIYKDTSISGNSDVGGIMNTTKINLTNDGPNNYPLVITNTGGNWFQGECIATANQVGCMFRYKTSGSSTYWWSGVWGSNTKGFNRLFSYKGLSIKSNGSAAISGNLDVGSTGDNEIKIHGAGVATAYAEFKKINNGYDSYWDFQNGDHSQAWPNISVKGSSFMSFSHHDNIIIHTRRSANWSDDRLKENEEFI